MRAGLIFVTLLAACGGDASSGAVSAEDAEAYCREGCTYENTCDGDAIEPCVTDCVSDVAGWYREDVLSDLVDCLTSQPCDATDDACFLACTPTASHERYETACRDALTACGAAPADLAPICETTPDETQEAGFLCAVAPGIMEELRQCFTDPDVSCTTYEPCLESVLDSHGIN